MFVNLVAATNNAERIIELAARISHDSSVKLGTDLKFLSKIIKLGHLSVLEHASATFHIRDISRACSHQFVRHRQLSFVQKSQRYVKENDFKYVIPDSLNGNSDYLNLMQKIKFNYQALLVVDNISKQDARFVLPNACVTEMIVSGNFRSWFEFLQKRLDKSSQWEIRELAKKIYCHLSLNSSIIFNKENLSNVTKFNLDI